MKKLILNQFLFKMDTFIVKSNNGNLEFKSAYHRGLFKQRLLQIDGKDFSLTIDEKKPKRSEQQNRFYWLYIRMIGDETGYTKDELHTLLSGKFLTKEIKEIMGLPVRVKKSTTDLTKSEFDCIPSPSS